MKLQADASRVVRAVTLLLAALVVTACSRFAAAPAAPAEDVDGMLAWAARLAGADPGRLDAEAARLRGLADRDADARAWLRLALLHLQVQSPLYDRAMAREMSQRAASAPLADEATLQLARLLATALDGPAPAALATCDERADVAETDRAAARAELAAARRRCAVLAEKLDELRQLERRMDALAPGAGAATQP